MSEHPAALGFEASMMRHTQLLIVDEIEDFSVDSLKWGGLDHNLSLEELKCQYFGWL